MITAAASCVLALVDTNLTRTGDAWVEQTDIVVDITTVCPFVSFELPAHAQLLDHKAKGKLSDDTRRKIRDDRWRLSERSSDGSRTYRVFLGDFLPQDRVEISLTRRWSSDLFLFQPGPTLQANLSVPPGAATSSPAVDGVVRLSNSTSATVIDVGTAGSGPRPVHPVGPPAASVARSRRLTLQIPAGDPQRLLYPGAGSSQHLEDFYAFGPSTLGQSVAVELPAKLSVDFVVEPSGAATLERGPDSALIRVRPWEGPVRVGLTYDVPDAPTFGERPTDFEEFSVKVADGHIAWEGDGWHLVSVGKRPILPNQQALLTGLDNRFRTAALPEPGLPQDLRGRARTWDLAADLRPTLFERAMSGLPGDPLWPRKLHKARKSGLITDGEAMVILWLYGRQAGLVTDWALVRPASAGPGYQAIPSGYTGALVRVEGRDEVRWIDAGCRVCAPFEVRPQYEDASIFSPAGVQGPAISTGSSTVVVNDDRVEWTLTGPAALRLREWLESIPAASRGAAIAERLAGPGALFEGSSGIGDAGAPISVTCVRGSGPVLDPLQLPPAGPKGVWADWVGERRRVFAGGDAHDASLDLTGITYARAAEEGIVTEVLTVTERGLKAQDTRAVDAIRRGVGP